MVKPMRRSHIFILRILFEDLGNVAHAMRVMVRNCESGETRYFHNLSDLTAFVDAVAATQERRDKSNESG